VRLILDLLEMDHFPADLDADQWTTGSPKLTAGSSSVGQDVSAIAAHVASHCPQSRPAKRAIRCRVEGARRTSEVASSSVHESRRSEL